MLQPAPPPPVPAARILIASFVGTAIEFYDFYVYATAAALVIAADPNSQVLGLVANAWAGFGAAFGPLILLALLWRGMTGAGAVAGLVTGAGVVAGWIALGWNKAFLGGPGLYEIVPGFFASMLAIVVVSSLTRPHAAAN